MTPETVARSLEEQRVVGWIETSFHDVHRKIRMLVGGDRSVQFGLQHLLPATAEEVVRALSELSGWDFSDGADGRGRTWVAPSAAVEQIGRIADRLREACERGERVFFGTGHPTGPLEMYARLAEAMRAEGAEVLRVGEGEHFEGYIGGSRIQYVCDVACVSMAGDLVHTHSAKPMEFLLGQGLSADLVVGDHGFTGAALAQGVDAVAVVDTNDPALVLAWARGLPIWPLLCDDNRPAVAYQALTGFLTGRLGRL